MSAGFNVEEWGPVHAIPTYHKAGAGERTAPFGTAEHPIPLIIDSDPGLDDALAIGLAAASPEIRLLAVTTVGGNADVTRCTENALRLLHAFGRDDVPVAEGAAGALLGAIVRATEVHGESGIGDTHLDPAPNAALPEGAVALMARLLAESPEPVAIAPIGPLTNVALLLRLYPHLATRISHICLMGGSVGEGNTTASAEFNIIADPEAADVVFRSGVPITMIGLDVTHQALLDRGVLEGAARPGHRLRPDRRGSHGLRARPEPRVERLVDDRDPRRGRGRAPHGPRPRRGGPLPRRRGHDERPGPRPHDLRRAPVPAPPRRPRAERRRRHRHRPRPVRAPPDRRVREAPVSDGAPAHPRHHRL